MVPLLTLMACLEALAASETNSKTIKPPGLPTAGIIIIDHAGSNVPSHLSPTDDSNHLVPVCGIIAGDYMAESGSDVANGSDRVGRSSL